MTPETKAKYEDFTIRWGQFVPTERREAFILETADIMTAFGKDCFEEFIAYMKASNDSMASSMRGGK